MANMLALRPRVNLSHVMIFVRDLDRSIWFYRDVLGLEPREMTRDWIEFASGPVRIAPHRADAEHGREETKRPLFPSRSEQGFSFCLTMDDVVGFCELLRQKGVSVVDLPRARKFGATTAQCLDPDGYRITLAERPAHG